MKFTRNIKAISKLLLILLLLTSTIIGAILSYLWVIGYFISLGIKVPDKTTVSITNATFNPQNASYFNVTLLNPSYSPSEASITQIVTSTEDIIHNVNATHPQLPYVLPKAKSATFQCSWNWGNYTGKTVKIIAFVADGIGPTFEIKTPLVDLRITDVRFNSTISVTHFNLTVQNNATSVTYVNITGVSAEGETISAGNISISLPHTLHQNESVSFKCVWNWTNYQNKNITVSVHTLQGYTAYRIHQTPKPINLTITNVIFNITNTTRFNITVKNSQTSFTHVNITKITVTVENQTFSNVTVVPPPNLPYKLERGTNVTFLCLWNWTNYREKNVTITVHTLQNFTVSSTQATTAHVILTITDISFDVADPSSFNVTVANSKFSEEEYVNITRVTVAIGNVVIKNITGAGTLYANTSVTLKCIWNWTNYWNKEVSIGVHTLQNYSAYGVAVTPSPVMISDILFDLSDTAHFNVTVENSEFFSTYVLITNITVTPENGAIQVVTVIPPTRLPYVLHPSNSVVFMCSWDWAEYCDQNVTVTVNTLQGYPANYTKRTPLPIIIEISDVLFDIADRTHFNVTVRNSEFSIEAANITRITVTMENGTALEMTEIVPSLPHLLGSDSSEVFMCLWNWTYYRGKNVTIDVYTLQGYTANYTITTPEPVILRITSFYYSPANTTYFNATVINSEYSLTQVNITRISVTLQNGTSWNVTVEPSLPYTLLPSEMVTFKCLWDWTAYQGQGQTVIIKVETLEGYTASNSWPIP